VHGKRRHRRVTIENGGGSVSLMDVTIQYQDAIHEAARLQESRGHGAVVENAKAFTGIRKSMMGSSGQIRGNANVQCLQAGGNRSSDRSAGTFNETW
jgi:hypothetical protein